MYNFPTEIETKIMTRYYRQRSGLVAELMQQIPKAPRKRKEEANYDNLKRASEIVLAVVAVAGLASVAVVAPNALLALNKFFLKKHKHLSPAEQQRKMVDTFYYLKRSGKIDLRPDGGSWKVWLTAKGKRQVLEMDIATVYIPKASKWGGTWWLIAADVPTKDHRQGADRLRRKLKQLNLFPLQRTLWLYPYDPCEALEVILHAYHIENFVTVMEVRKLDREDERKAKAHFRNTGVL